MSFSAVRSISDAIELTRRYLLPLSFRRWWRLVVIVAFLGTAGTPVPASPQLFDPRLWQGPSTDSPPGPATTPSEPIVSALPPLTELAPPSLGVVLGLGAAVGIGYLVCGAMMQFLFVEALQSQQVTLLAPAKKHGVRAIELAILRIGLLAGGLLPVAGLIAGVFDILPVIALSPSRGTIALAVGVTVAIWLVDLFTRQFVVPIAITSETGLITGWIRLLSTIGAARWEYLIFIIARVLIGAAVGIVSTIAVVFVVLALLVFFGTAAAVVVVLVGGIDTIGGLAMIVLAALAVGFGLSTLAVFPVLQVPFQTYLQYYALLVLGDTNRRFDLIPDRRANLRAQTTDQDHSVA